MVVLLHASSAGSALRVASHVTRQHAPKVLCMYFYGTVLYSTVLSPITVSER